jgi:hypothetical protein
MENEWCPACGDVIDFCRGHGLVGDTRGYVTLRRHDMGNHRDCHPGGCEDSAEIQDHATHVSGELCGWEIPEGTCHRPRYHGAAHGDIDEAVYAREAKRLRDYDDGIIADDDH